MVQWGVNTGMGARMVGGGSNNVAIGMGIVVQGSGVEGQHRVGWGKGMCRWAMREMLTACVQQQCKRKKVHKPGGNTVVGGQNGGVAGKHITAAVR